MGKWLIGWLECGEIFDAACLVSAPRQVLRTMLAVTKREINRAVANSMVRLSTPGHRDRQLSASSRIAPRGWTMPRQFFSFNPEDGPFFDKLF